MQLSTLSFALATAMAFPYAVLAQQATDSATDLDEVVVTATRTSVSTSAALAPVEVIDREEIARSQARSLPDLLRGRAGISMSNQGGPGKLTTLFMRGSESDHVLVLIDGVRIGSATSGLVSFQDLPIDQIDRVEIVRGPRSSLYGSEAIGGVIHIFTRRETPGYAPRLHVGTGSHDLREFGAGFGGRGESSWFGADYAYRQTDGFNACDVATPSPWAGCFISSPQPDRDGYRNQSVSVHGGIQFNPAWSLDAHATRAEAENDFDGDFVNGSETVQQIVGGTLRWQASEALDVKLTAGRNKDASDNLLDGQFRGYFDTDRDSATLQGDMKIGGEQLLTLGVDWLHDHVESDTPFDETTRGNRAVFAQYQGALGTHALQASLRRDDNDQFGEYTTGAAAWGVDLGADWRATAGYGTAFKAPTFNELYYPFFGNPALRPEESETWEAGVRYRHSRFNARLDAFHTEVDDLITYDAAIFLPNNIERARMRGAELGVDAEIMQWSLDASASYLDTENRSGFNAGNELPRRARSSARVDIDRVFGRLGIGLTAVAEGARFDDVANTRRLPGYATLDLRAQYALTPAWTLQARLANLLDRDYETAAFFNQPGREWFLTLRYAPMR
ncbi:MAG: TonB-dependent vitamin B12 receptor [Pseudomonadota bacterium]|nr:TonB-dependent vitamin B12 receptor [Pseudomonadota bacterium]